ncbi:MAG TPA: hypothetical protein VHL57_02785, partial [Flavobacteriales bacterium]|nr:hypothetical protein [Flavobacteriales bacterium]
MFYLIATAVLGCSSGSVADNASSPVIDSCATAVKFDMAMQLEQGLGANGYTGELKNYMGEDTTRLDFRHVFENGHLVASYFYDTLGGIQEEFHFRCAALHGVQKQFHPNGVLAGSIPYRYGRLQGL